MLLRLPRAQTQRIEAAFEIGRHGDRDARLPAAIDQRIVVKDDAAILRGIEPEAVSPALPVPAGHGTYRPIDALGMQCMRTDVDNGVADAAVGIAHRGVPMRDHGAGRLLAGTRQRFDRIWREHFTGEAGAIDLAAIEHADEAAAAGVFLPGAGPQKEGGPPRGPP